MRSHRSMTWAAFLTVAALITFAPGAVRAQDVIRFGVSTPLSGPAAPWGIPHKNATELIFDEINAQGGLDVGGKKYKLEVVAYDHKYVIAEGVATVNRLIAKDGVKYISVLGGSVVKANEEAVNESRVLNLPLAYADGLVSPKNPLTFHAFPSPPETTAFWKWIKEKHPQIKRVATLSPNDDTGWWSIKVETNYVAEARVRGRVEGVLRAHDDRLQPGAAAHPRPEAGHHQRAGLAGGQRGPHHQASPGARVQGALHPHRADRHLGGRQHRRQGERGGHVGARVRAEPAAREDQELAGALHQEVRRVERHQHRLRQSRPSPSWRR